jgi:hypothetical protein
MSTQDLMQKFEDLRNDAIQKLDDNLRYFAHSKSLWRYLQAEHGTLIMSQPDGEESVDRIIDVVEMLPYANDYIRLYLQPQTFKYFLIIYEMFFSDFLKAYFRKFPEQFNNKTVTLREIFDFPALTKLLTLLLKKNSLAFFMETLKTQSMCCIKTSISL